jgi:MYXO-CTERM domain-containing protein
LLGLVVLVVALLGGSRPARATTYIFATFKGDDAAGMKLSVYTSTDSTSFALLSDTGFGGNTTYLRDPSIMKYTDGKYYIAYTDPMKASCCNPEDHFGIAVSSDLIHWTDLTTVKAGVPNVSRVWAPEWYIEAGVVRVIANIDTGNADFEPYVFTALDSTLTSWSGPTALGIGPDYIDTYVAKLGSTYHAFIKSETTRYLEHATAPSLTGPWTFVGKDNWAGWGSGMEGPAIVQLDDGTYKMYVDPQSGGTPCQYMTSSDLNKWSARASIPGTAGTTLRHGTVIRDAAGLGSNGYFTGAGGSSGTGGSIGTGGATGKGGVVASGGGTGGVATSGGTQGSGGSMAAGGSKGTGGSMAMGGSTSAATADGSVTGGAGGSGPGTGGRGGSGSGGTMGSSGGNADTGVGGSTGAGGAANAGGTGFLPDVAFSTGGIPATGGAGIIASGGSGGAGTGGSATGGAIGAGSQPDAGGFEATTPSGCNCAVPGGSPSRPASPWLWLALGALILTARRAKPR